MSKQGLWFGCKACGSGEIEREAQEMPMVTVTIDVVCLEQVSHVGRRRQRSHSHHRNSALELPEAELVVAILVSREEKLPRGAESSLQLLMQRPQPVIHLSC